MAYLRFNIKSEMIGQSMDIDVFLPKYNRWNNCEPPFKTLYFLAGYAASSKEIITFVNIQKYASEYGLALVTVTGDRTFYIDQPDIMEMYGRFVGQELVELTRSLLPLSHRREDTYIGGISMGGYGALCNGLRYGDNFSRIVLLSPGIWCSKEDAALVPVVIKDKIQKITGDFNSVITGEHSPVHYIDTELENGRKIPELFLRCGRQDELVFEGNENFVRALNERQVLVDFTKEDGLHDWEFWSRMMKPAFEFLTQSQSGS